MLNQVGRHQPRLYITIVLVALLAGIVHKLRVDGIFACDAGGYSNDRYLAYCQASSYGEYDHGAFWFGLEPRIQEAVRRAQVLFLGNSQLQFGFSTATTAEWFAAAANPYYLLGFNFNERHVFAEQLLKKIGPQARVYVINISSFFEVMATEPAQLIMRSPRVPLNLRVKNWWQVVHRPFCSTLPSACGREYAIFRSRDTGAWSITADVTIPSAVTYESQFEHDQVQELASVGRRFLDTIAVDPRCVVLTVVPMTGTKYGMAQAVAREMGVDLIAPELPGLTTLESVHLDQPSAESWSRAFFAAAGPRIRQCLGQQLTAQR